MITEILLADTEQQLEVIDTKLSSADFKRLTVKPKGTDATVFFKKGDEFELLCATSNIYRESVSFYDIHYKYYLVKAKESKLYNKIIKVFKKLNTGINKNCEIIYDNSKSCMSKEMMETEFIKTLGLNGMLYNKLLDKYSDREHRLAEMGNRQSWSWNRRINSNYSDRIETTTRVGDTPKYTLSISASDYIYNGMIFTLLYFTPSEGGSTHTSITNAYNHINLVYNKDVDNNEFVNSMVLKPQSVKMVEYLKDTNFIKEIGFLPNIDAGSNYGFQYKLYPPIKKQDTYYFRATYYPRNATKQSIVYFTSPDINLSSDTAIPVDAIYIDKEKSKKAFEIYIDPYDLIPKDVYEDEIGNLSTVKQILDLATSEEINMTTSNTRFNKELLATVQKASNESKSKLLETFKQKGIKFEVTEKEDRLAYNIPTSLMIDALLQKYKISKSTLNDVPNPAGRDFGYISINEDTNDVILSYRGDINFPSTEHILFNLNN